MFIYQSRFLTRGEVWFDEEPNGARVDWIYHRQRSKPLPNCRWKQFYTVLVDLQETSEELLAGMEERTSRRILEAQDSDKLQCEYCDSRDSGIIDQVERMWNEFAIAQKTRLFERYWLDQIRQAGRLEVVVAKSPGGNVLAYHLVFLTPKRARQLIAISPYRAVPEVTWRNAVSRANCFIHWHNFLTFRERGISCFDFGGWYTGRTNIQFLGINRFKKSFGGNVVLEYDCEQPVTLKGWILLSAAQMLARVRQARVFGRLGSENHEKAVPPKEREASPAFR